MSQIQKTLAVFAAAAGLRLVLLVALDPQSLSTLLAGRVEISTPVTSFKRLQEGLFLYTRNVSPYDGGVYHQAPLLLPIFSLLPDYETFPLPTHLVYILADLLSGYALLQIADSGESSSTRLFTSPRKGIYWSSLAIAGAFLFNPFSLLSCLAQSTKVLTNCAVLHAVAKASQGNVTNSIMALAVASYLSLHPALLAAPLALLTYDRTCRSSKHSPAVVTFFGSYALGFIGVLAALIGLSYLAMDFSWEFIASTYGVQIRLPDLTPNVGLWWYFFVEMFDSFREFFLAVFWLHMASYVGGLTFRMRKQPLFVITALVGIFAVYQPYPSISDAALYFALLPLYRHIFPLMRYSFIAIAAVLYSTFLGPAFYHLWIYAGSGNANFFYAITLVWSLGSSIIVADSIYAVLRDEFEVERPEIKGQDVRQI